MTNTTPKTIALSTLFEDVNTDFLDAFDNLLPVGDVTIISMVTFQQILTAIERNDSLTGDDVYIASLESVHERLSDVDQSSNIDILE